MTLADSDVRGNSWPAGSSRRLTTTFGYYVAFVGLGLVSASLGPTLPGLAENTGAQLGQISTLFTTRSLGYLLGSLLAGRLYDRMAGHPVIVVVLFVIGAALIVTPLISLLWLLAAVLLVIGTSEGMLDVGGNTLLVWVHRSKVGPYMNALHFFFGVGAFVSPLIIAQAVEMTGGITWAYWALAILVFPISLWLIWLPSPAPYTSSGAFQGGGSSGMLVLLISLFMFMYVGAEVSVGGWVYTYAVTLGLADAKMAAILTSVFWGALTVGRLIGIPIAATVRPRAILLGDLVVCLVSIGIILVWPNSLTVLWVGTFGVGLGMASIFPTVLSWAERRMMLSGFATSWFFVGASAGAMTFPWIIGQFFESQGPQVTMLTIFSVLIASFAMLIVLMIYGGAPNEDGMTEDDGLGSMGEG